MRIAWLLGLALLVVPGCKRALTPGWPLLTPAPPPGLWPPSSSHGVTTVIVSSDTWHSVIGVPLEGGDLEEWGFANRSWCLNTDHSIPQAVSAVFTPSPAVVEIARFPEPFHRRSPNQPGRHWELRLGPESMERLRAYLRGSKAGDEPVLVEEHRAFYPATQPYHGLHHCHHWVAQGLWTAGLPVYRWHSAGPVGLWAQLDELAPSTARETVLDRASVMTMIRNLWEDFGIR